MYGYVKRNMDVVTRGEVRSIVASETTLTAVLLTAVGIVLVGLIAWLAYDIFVRKREIGNLTEDINTGIVHPLRRTTQHVSDLQVGAKALAAQAASTSNAIFAADAALSDKFGVGGSSNLTFFNGATTRGILGADLQLLRHTSAVMGLTVASRLDVSGGYFSVDGSTGTVSMCASGARAGSCTQFNDAAGNVHLRAAPTGYVGIDARAVLGGGSGYAGSGPSALDVSGGVVASGPFTAVAGATTGAFSATQAGVSLSAVGAPLSLSSVDATGLHSMTCALDPVSGMTVTNRAGGGAPTTVLQIDAANNMTINAANLKISATNVDVSGNLRLYGQPIVAGSNVFN